MNHPPVAVSRACEVHPKHDPRSFVVEIHHVWPLRMGGPDTPENMVAVCPTGHANIHDLLRQTLAAGARLPYSYTRTYSRKERQIAELGFERITNGSM